ncbi:MAG: ABC transporter permease [Puniceicoccales bacterium]|jgi:putative ABC transport system permease protein|nr:ABC transporter permease [Puniceicoccales bacterium]
MIFLNAFHIAIREISRNLPRAFLTVLGIIIGVAAVITMQTLGQGTTEVVRSQFSRFGENLLFVRPGLAFGPRSASAGIPSFTEDDIVAIREQLPSVKDAVPAKNAALTTRFRQNARSTGVVGTYDRYFAMNNWELADGRVFNDAEERNGAAVCVIGETVRRELFNGAAANPVGSKILIRNVACEIIGVLKSKGQMGWRDQDDTIIMPLTSLNQRIAGHVSIHDIDNIVVAARVGTDSAKVTTALTSLLRQRRNLKLGQDDNFSIFEPRQIAESISSTMKTMTSLLAAVAGVALLVGGIGIMNIMLVSVTERTREIGIRLAIGARAGEVLLQFLVEAATLSCLGGLLGIALAIILCAALAPLIGVAFHFNLAINFIAFLFSALVGIVFGFTPARRAAALDPIEALRHE